MTNDEKINLIGQKIVLLSNNLDKYKISNDGTYRAFEKHHYRIVYRFGNNVIRVLKVTHTKMNPKEY